MATGTPLIYTDDTDPSWTFTIRSTVSTTNVDWVSPLVAVAGGNYTIAATWLGTADTTRKLEVPLSTLTTAGDYHLYLKVPNGADIPLGKVSVRART